MSIIGDNIQRFRKLRGLTQEELAKLMGYKSKSTINKIELGVNDIPQSKIAKFASVLGTTPAEIMGWETPVLTGDVNTFWQRFFVLCRQNGTTPNDVARVLGIDKKCIPLWESGQIPHEPTLHIIALHFGVSSDYLLGNENPPEPFATPSADSVFSLSKEEQEILLTFRENEAFREAVMNIYRLTKPAEQKTVRVFRAARSADNHGPEVVDMDAARLERLKNLPDTDDPL